MTRHELVDGATQLVRLPVDCLQPPTNLAELCAAPPDGLSPGQNNNGDPDQYAQVDVVSWCEACVHPIDLTVNPETNPSLIRMNLSAIAVPGACSCKDSLKLYV